MAKKLLQSHLLVFALLVTGSFESFAQAPCPTDVTITGQPGQPICEGSEVTLNANVTGNDTGLTYEWRIDNVVKETNNSQFTTVVTQTNPVISVTVTADGVEDCVLSDQIIITTNKNRTGQIEIQADNEKICPGETVNFSIRSSGETGNNPQYDWRVNSTSAGSKETFSAALGAGDDVQLFVTSSLPCTDGFESNVITISEKPGIPQQPGAISGSEVSCPGVPQTYSISDVTDATSYTWELPDGWSGSSSTTEIQVTTGPSGGTIRVTAENECGESEEQILNVTIEPGTPGQPEPVSGNPIVCPGIQETYQVNAVPDAEEYVWSFPSDWGNGNPIITTTPEVTLTTGSPGSGTITVLARNSCGEGQVRNMDVTVEPGTPETPGSISGSNEVCPATEETYQITAVSDAEEYLWTFPSDWGNGSPITTTIPEVTLTTGAPGNASISVLARNSCGDSSEQSFQVTINPGTPDNAGEISLDYSNPNGVICPGDQLVFSVTGTAETEEYSWNVPAGWTVNGSKTGNSITVMAGSYGQNGSITVNPVNSCGTGSESSLPVSIDPPAPEISGELTGPEAVCATETALTYSIPDIEHATEYNWDFPDGWNITAGETSSTVTVDASSTGGTISAYAINNCGDSAPLTLEVGVTSDVPSAPGPITTNLSVDAICPPASGITFSVTDDPEVDSYQWTLPPGWEIASGEGTSGITVNVTNNAAYSNESVSVEAMNICGNSTASTYTDITVSDFAIADLGEDRTVCRVTDPITIDAVFGFENKKLSITSITATNSSGTDTELDVPSGKDDKFEINYTPSAADLTAGEVTLTLTTEAPAGACGPGVDEMTIYFRPDPTAEITGSTDICTGSSADLEFTGTPNTTVTYRVNTGADQTIGLDANGTALVNSGSLSENAVYQLVSIRYSQDPACSQNISGEATITVNEVPNAEISYEEPAFCEDDTTTRDITFTNTIGAYENGSFSASPSGLIINESSGQIDPGTSAPGDYRITYTIPATLGCEVVELSTDVSITAVPTVTMSYMNSPFCSSDPSLKQVSLEGTGVYEGGTFTAVGLEIDPGTGAIDPSASTPGTHTVTYTTPAGAGCTPYEFTTEVAITETPISQISYTLTELCTSGSLAQDVDLTGTGQVEGGSYSASAGLTIVPESGQIDPATSEPGNYTVVYTLPGIDGCGETTAETEISITRFPSAEISYEGPFCASESTEQAVNFTNNQGNYEAGSFSASPAGLDINATTGAITPSGSTAGDYTIEYLMPAAGGCEQVLVTTSVSITEVPTAAIGYSTAPFCTSDESIHAVSFTGTAEEYQNGSFSGSTGLQIDSMGNIDASGSTPGTHTVTYSIPAADSCGEVLVTTEILIYERPQITSQPFNLAICSTEPTELSVVATGDDLTYQWYKIGAGETVGQVVPGATSAELFNSNTTSADAGQYYVEVSGPGSCSPVTSDTVILNVDEDIIILEPAEDESVCSDGISEVTFRFVAHANGSPLDFTWIKDGDPIDVSDSNFTITTAEIDENGHYEGTLKITGISNEDVDTYNGNYNVEINGPQEFTCPTAISNTFFLRVDQMPDPPQVEEIIYCQFEEAGPLTVLDGSNLTWYPTESAADPLEGTPVPDTDTQGSTSYWVSQTPDVCESERAEVIVTVKEKPEAPQTTQLVEYCLGATPEALAATGDPNATLNWYNTADATEALPSAPLPDTETASTTSYWVSQTLEACESDRVQIEVIINELPVVSVTAVEETICLGSEVELTAEGASTYFWEDENGQIGEGAILTVSPEISTTYTVTGTDEKGCSNSAEITIEVDQPSVAGTLTAPASVCVSNPNGTLELNGHNGDITGWEYKPESTTEWLVLNENNLDSIQDFAGLSESTSFRVAVKSGVCEPVFAETTVEVDPEPVGGTLAFDMTGSDRRFFMICENPEPGYAVDVSLTGHVGEILSWKYREITTGWSTLQVGGEPFTGTTLSAQQIENLGINQTTIFRVEIASGACTPNAFSETAIISVIPSNIEPEPVEVDPEVVCFGEEVTLSAENGYTDRPDILDQGAFDNASITNQGWRIRRNNNTEDVGFDTDANNVVPDRWKRATPRAFTTADITSPYSTSQVRFDTGIEDGNKGFAIVSANNTSTMETSVFAMGPMDQAILTFDQAYSLTPGASIMVEISTDGGATYENVLYRRDGPLQSGNYGSFGTGTVDTTPENKIRVDLGNYLGGNNLRIRFNYTGARSGDIWALDNIDIPDGPRDVTIEWNDHSDPENPVFIGNSNSEKWTPTKIGLNTFEIKTLLIYNSNGDACANAEHTETITVYVFDSYTSTAAAEVSACGVGSVQLTGSLEGAEQGIIEEFPEGDQSVAAWEVVEGPEGYAFSEAHFSSNDTEVAAINDPAATFTPDVPGTYTIRWAITPDADSNCETTYVDTTFELMGCSVLDFDGVDDFIDLGTSYSGSYSLEAWVRPEAGDGTIISKRDQHNSGAGYELGLNNGKAVFKWNGVVLTSPESLAVNDRWYHLAVSFDGTNATLYVDGINSDSNNTSFTDSEAPMIIGASYDILNDSITDHFSGWIEEVRIWNGSITQEQIQFLMNQRLQDAANIGVEIPMPAPGLSYADLAGYYRLIATDILAGGFTADLAFGANHGQLRNMETLQENTAPLPYTTSANGKWTDQNATWTHADVWDIPNADGLNEEPIEWNIVRTAHDVTSEDKDITILGLISETGELTIADPTDTQDETNTGQMLRVTHYLKLDGSIDLVGESQLLQDTGSIVDAASTGFLERDQQGTASSYNYNYWSSPVSPGTGNAAYTIGGVMKDGTTTEPRELDFGNPYAYADGGPEDPRKVSNYWLNKFHGTSHQYSEWVYVGSTGTLNVGEGYSMKGTSGQAAIEDPQNYTFKGIPNNADITLNINTGQDYLVGNPYPSAIDAREFILDNMKDVSSSYGEGRNSQNVFSGALYFWSHFSGKTHYLQEYIGGYAVYNLSGGTIAIANDERINATNDSGGEIPGDFIPVGQAFFLTTFLDGNLNYSIHGGSIQFQNSQRVYKREHLDESVFHSPESGEKTVKQSTDDRLKIWLKFQSPTGIVRQLLATADPNTSNDFDLGYDALLIENHAEDMYWYFSEREFVIQGVEHFNEDQELALGVRIKNEEPFIISIDQLKNIPDEMNIYLKDSLHELVHDLREEPYESTAEPGEITDRFSMVFTKEELAVDDEEEVEIITGDLNIMYVNGTREVLVKNPGLVRISKIYINNLLGQQLHVYENVPLQEENRLPVRMFSSGVYIIKAHTEDGILTKKIILE